VDAPISFDRDDAPAWTCAAHATCSLDCHEWTFGGGLDEGAASRENGDEQQSDHSQHRPR
jgi:hypothetical protein